MNRTSGQTLRVATVLAWEFLASGWRGILFGPAIALFAPGLILSSAIGKQPSEVAAAHSIVSSSAFYWMTVMCLGSALFVSSVKPKLHYTLPASSSILAACPLACAMLTAFVQYAFVATILNQIGHAGWPILGPGLLAAFLIGWCLAIWSATSNSLELRCLAWVASFIVLFVAVRRWGPKIDQSILEFLPTVGRWHGFFFVLATAACAGIGSFGFASQRRGAGVDFRRLMNRLSGRFRTPLAVPTRPFTSRSTAQFWLEWMERGYVLPGWNTLVGISVLVIALCAPLPEVTKNGDAMLLARGVLPFLFFAPVLIIGFLLGSRSRDFTFRNFNGSRPLTDGQLAAAVLRSATVALVSAALVCAAFVALVASVMAARQGMWGHFAPLRQADVVSFLAGVVLAALVLWSVVGFVTSLALAGRKAIATGVLLGVGVLLVGIMLDQSLRQPKLVEAYFKFWLVVVFIGGAAVFVASWRCRLISVKTLCLAAAIVLVALAVTRSPGPPGTWESQALEFCSCALIPVPLAAAPLAVYFNRHR